MKELIKEFIKAVKELKIKDLKKKNSYFISKKCY